MTELAKLGHELLNKLMDKASSAHGEDGQTPAALEHHMAMLNELQKFGAIDAPCFSPKHEEDSAFFPQVAKKDLESLEQAVDANSVPSSSQAPAVPAARLDQVLKNTHESLSDLDTKLLSLTAVQFSPTELCYENVGTQADILVPGSVLTNISRTVANSPEKRPSELSKIPNLSQFMTCSREEPKSRSLARCPSRKTVELAEEEEEHDHEQENNAPMLTPGTKKAATRTAESERRGKMGVLEGRLREVAMNLVKNRSFVSSQTSDAEEVI